MVDVAKVFAGCGEDCYRLSESQPGCAALWGAVVEGQVEDRQWPEGVVMNAIDCY